MKFRGKVYKCRSGQGCIISVQGIHLVALVTRIGGLQIVLSCQGLHRIGLNGTHKVVLCGNEVLIHLIEVRMSTCKIQVDAGMSVQLALYKGHKDE